MVVSDVCIIITTLTLTHISTNQSINQSINQGMLYICMYSFICECIVFLSLQTYNRLPLFQRYRAMFTLRNIGDKEAIEALCAGFNDKSALFKHEIAYVLGQMGHTQSEEAAAALKEMLKDESQHPMTRHEAAEALGSVSETDATTKFLQEFQKDDNLIVSQSCDVALDIQEYWHGEGDDDDLLDTDKTDADADAKTE
jgi:hypothetical protein